MSFFGGRQEKIEQVPTLSPEQQSFLSQILQNLAPGGGAATGYQSAIDALLKIIGGGDEGMGAIEAPQRRAFEEKTIPSILERFTARGARSSSGLQQTLGEAGQRLEEGLGSQQAQRQQTAIGQLLSNFLSQSQLGLGTRGFENILRPAQPGFIQSLLSNLGEASQQAGQMAGQLPFLMGGI